MMVTTTPVLKHYVIVTILFYFRLGAVHDGDNNACSKTLRYIMVSISSAMTKPYHRNPWKFSNCTVREIGLYLDKLNKYEHILLFIIKYFVRFYICIDTLLM